MATFPSNLFELLQPLDVDKLFDIFKTEVLKLFSQSRVETEGKCLKENI